MPPAGESNPMQLAIRGGRWYCGYPRGPLTAVTNKYNLWYDIVLFLNRRAGACVPAHTGDNLPRLPAVRKSKGGVLLFPFFRDVLCML